jgi:hypothetical protein
MSGVASWFDGTRPVKAWLDSMHPDQMVVIYNDHLNFFEFQYDITPLQPCIATQ